MLISAVLIVRDESAMIDACLASISRLVDEIVVVDTGSVDDTREIAGRYGARVIEHRWEGDFGAARNVGLDAARGEWILYENRAQARAWGAELRRLVSASFAASTVTERLLETLR